MGSGAPRSVSLPPSLHMPSDLPPETVASADNTLCWHNLQTLCAPCLCTPLPHWRHFASPEAQDPSLSIPSLSPLHTAQLHAGASAVLSRIPKSTLRHFPSGDPAGLTTWSLFPAMLFLPTQSRTVTAISQMQRQVLRAGAGIPSPAQMPTSGTLWGLHRPLAAPPPCMGCTWLSTHATPASSTRESERSRGCLHYPPSSLGGGRDAILSFLKDPEEHRVFSHHLLCLRSIKNAEWAE